MTPLHSPKAIDEPVPIPAWDLSRAIAALPDGGMLQLPAGTFRIVCDGVHNKFTKNGITICGSGYQRTVIQRDPNPAFAENNQHVLWFSGDDITIEDMTLDAGGAEGDQFVHACLRIDGNGSAVRRVRGINASGCSARNLECFAFFICPERSARGTGLVSECLLTQVKGDYVEGFCVWGAAKVENSRVEFPSLLGNSHPPFLNGFQAAYSNGASFSGCSQVGGSGFFYTDTGSDSNLRVVNFTAIDVQQGIIMVRGASESVDGFLIDGGIIELSTGALVADGANGIAISGGGTARNVRVTNNLVRYVGGAVGPASNRGRLIAAGVVTSTRSGTVISGNTWDRDFDGSKHEDTALVTDNNPVAASQLAPDPTNPS